MYCELGETVTGDSGTFWDKISAANKLPDATSPTHCKVPAIKAADNTVTRPDVYYYVSGLANETESDDLTTPWKKWNAKAKHTAATTAEAQTTDAASDGNQRTKSGELAYWTQAKVAADWVVMQR